MNLSKFPTITNAKTLFVEIDINLLTSQIFLPYDKEIDNSLIKGIRNEYVQSSTGITNISPYSYALNLNIVFPQFANNNIGQLDPAISAYFGITLVDDNNNNILQDYPLNGLNNPTIGANANTDYIRRFNSKVNLQKSFISLLDKTQAGFLSQSDVYFACLTFYYKPKN